MSQQLNTRSATVLAAALLGLFSYIGTVRSGAITYASAAESHATASPELGGAVELTTSTLQTDKISPRVKLDIGTKGKASVVLVLADKADLSDAAAIQNPDERGWYVYKTLTRHAAQSQAGLRRSLDARGISYQSFWAANIIVLEAETEMIESLAKRADVLRIDSNAPTQWIEDPEISNYGVESRRLASPETVEWGIANINAPAVWAMGYTGQGIIVGNQDTGIRWTHTSIKNKYRGWNGSAADHNYNWFDAIHSEGGTCGPNSVVPCDDNGHGTHTMATSVGDDGSGNQVGVAPGARWMGCRNMDRGLGTPATYTECFQFFISTLR